MTTLTRRLLLIAAAQFSVAVIHRLAVDPSFQLVDAVYWQWASLIIVWITTTMSDEVTP